MLRLHQLIRTGILPVCLVLLPVAVRAQTPLPAGKGPTFWAQSGSDSHAFLGVGVTEIDSERAKALKLREEYGVEITRVDEDSPAEHAGLKAGDVILAYNGQRVEGAQQFIRLVRETPPGRTVKLTIVRAGAQQTIPATLGARRSQLFGPEMGEMHIEVPEWSWTVPDVPRAMTFWRSAMLGVEAEGLGDTQLANYFGVKDGVLVRSVFKGSAAEKAGLKAGDVLLKVDKDTVTTPREVTGAIRNSQRTGKNSFPVVLMRDHKETSLTVTIEDVHPSPARPASSPVKQRL